MNVRKRDPSVIRTFGRGERTDRFDADNQASNRDICNSEAARLFAMPHSRPNRAFRETPRTSSVQEIFTKHRYIRPYIYRYLSSRRDCKVEGTKCIIPFNSKRTKETQTVFAEIISFFPSSSLRESSRSETEEERKRRRRITVTFA